MTDQKIGDWATLSPPGTLPVLDNIFQVSDKFLGQLKLYLEQHPPSTPITSILGFAQFSAKAATTILTSEATTSMTYVDLTTVGPTLTGLPDGQYVIFFGCTMSGPAATDLGLMSVDVNAAGAVDNDSCSISSWNGAGGGSGSTMRAVLKTLSNGGNNTLTTKYRSNAGGSWSFQQRWMMALKYANK